ncbi:MAG: 50S ribosomal protein L10 [Thermodesulfobacteriota bacterium]
MNREDKADLVAELHEKFVQAQFAVVTDYRGMPVAVMEQLRRQLRTAGSEYRVAKNTLLRRAMQGTSYEALQGTLEGTTAVAVTNGDPVATAKVVTDFSKDNPAFVVRAGGLGGKLLTIEDVKALAALPGREILLAMLLGAMRAVPSGLVGVLAGVPRQFLNVLTAIKDQKEQAAN